MMKHRIGVPCALLSAIMIAGVQQARAQQNDAGTMSLEELMKVRVSSASRADESAFEAPATVYVISKSDIQERGYATLADVLKDLPGMETVENYYSEQGTLVPVRGIVGNNKIILLVNGMRVNPPGGEELMIRSDVNVRFAEQIEVIYGQGSTLYGQDAISAIINIKTKAPEAHAGNVRAGFGKNNTESGFVSFGRTLQASSSPVTLTAYGSYAHSDLSNFSSEFPVWWQKYTGFLQQVGRSTVPWRQDVGYNGFGRAEARGFSLQAWYRDSARSSTEGSGEGGINPVLWFVDEAKWHDRSLVIEGQHTASFSKALALRSIVTVNKYDIDPESRYVFPVDSDLFLKDFKYGFGRSQSIEEKLDYTPRRETRVTVGLVGTHYHVLPKVSVLGGADPSGDVVEQAGSLVYYRRANDVSSAVSVPRAEELRYHTFGVYAEGSHRFSASLKGVAGARLDTNSRIADNSISPRAALIYNVPGDRLVLKYIFSKAYVAPAPYFGHNVFDNGVQISGPNANLQPERSASNEFNATWHEGDLLANASVYYNHQSNLLITAQSESPETIAEPLVYVNPDGTGPRLVRHSINLGSGHSDGIDLSTRYNLQGIAFWGSYSFVDASRTVGALTTGLDQISAHNVRAGATIDAPFDIAVTPSLVWRSTPANLTSNYDVPGVNLSNPHEVNLNVLYRPVGRFDAFVTIRNLTNRHYALRGVAGPALQEPFAVSAGLHWKY